MWTWPSRQLLATLALAWSVYAIVHYLSALPAVQPAQYGALGAVKVIRALSGFGVTALLFSLSRRKHRGANRLWFIQLGISGMLAAATWLFLDRFLLGMFATVAGFAIPWAAFPHGVDLDYVFVIFVAIIAREAFVLIDQNRAQREQLLQLELVTQRARLDLLAAQLNPHFVFNALNTIRSLAAEDPVQTRDMVSRLASFLRRALDLSTALPVPLVQELAFGRDYLAIESARFEQPIVMTVDIPAHLENFLVVPLILQPLLENAVKHGVRDVAGGRQIRVSAEMVEQRVTLRICNAGTLTGASEGTGIKITRARLQQTYGTRQTFHLTETGNEVCATISIHTTDAKSA